MTPPSEVKPASAKKEPAKTPGSGGIFDRLYAEAETKKKQEKQKEAEEAARQVRLDAVF